MSLWVLRTTGDVFFFFFFFGGGGGGGWALSDPRAPGSRRPSVDLPTPSRETEIQETLNPELRCYC